MSGQIYHHPFLTFQSHDIIPSPNPTNHLTSGTMAVRLCLVVLVMVCGRRAPCLTLFEYWVITSAVELNCFQRLAHMLSVLFPNFAATSAQGMRPCVCVSVCVCECVCVCVCIYGVCKCVSFVCSLHMCGVCVLYAQMWG